MEMESRHLAVMFIDWGAVLTSIGCSHSTIQQLVSISVAWYVDLYFTVFVPNKSLSFLLPFIVFLDYYWWHLFFFKFSELWWFVGLLEEFHIWSFKVISFPSLLLF
jgi:hypothetical protein